MNNNTNNNVHVQEAEQEINIKALIEQYLYYWKWFVLAMCIALLGAFAYLTYATKQYTVDAKILLPDESSAKGELAGLADLASITGSSGSSAQVMDQIDVLKSRRLINKVVEKLKLNVTYQSKDGFHKSFLTADQAPFKFVLLNDNPNYLDTVRGGFEIEILSATQLLLTDTKTKKDVKYNLGNKLNTAVGEIMLIPNSGSINKVVGKTFEVSVQPMVKVREELVKAIQISPNTEKQSNIINFGMTLSSVKLAQNIIDELINQYNVDLTSDKNKLTKATSKFISDRLAIISGDLSAVDKNAEQFKEGNQLTDVEAEAKLYLETASESDKKVMEQRTQLKLVDYMRESIKSNKAELLPSNIGLQDLSIEKTISEYNKMVLERDDLLQTSTSDNPVVQNINDNIRTLNLNLMRSLDNYRAVTQLALNSAQGKKSELQGKLGNLPKTERGYRDISRQQQIVETLYLFLLQKREENEIKAAATPDNIKIIDSAYGNDIPVAPKKSIILLAALMLGLIVPFAAIYLKFLFDNKVQSRKDIEQAMKVPVLGEIPTSVKHVIEENDRSPLAEAFRILRTNMNFMLGTKKDQSKVIFITSTTSGEGKSFVSTNLAKILAMSGKNVLLIGADIRSPRVLDYLGLSHLQHTNIGITQYMINPDMDIANIVIKTPDTYKFDIIYSGYVAPNPAELLMNGHFDDVIAYARTHYDYVLVDTAPVSLVTDTLLIAHNADLTMYVTRANYLDKRLLNIPKELFEQQKLKNMAVVLNDVDFARGYGYGYGYGYGEGNTSRGFWKKYLEKFFNFFSRK